MMKEIREEPNKWRYFTYIDRKTQYNVCNHNDDTTKLLSGYRQTDSHGKSEDQNINNFRGAEQRWRMDTAWLQSLQSHSNQNNMVLLGVQQLY